MTVNIVCAREEEEGGYLLYSTVKCTNFKIYFCVGWQMFCVLLSLIVVNLELDYIMMNY